MTTTVTAKGQVTIPKKVRTLMGIRPGSAVRFELSERGEVVLKAAGRTAGPRKSRFAALRGRATVRLRTEEILALTRG
jgi:antitoxin PrlF